MNILTLLFQNFAIRIQASVLLNISGRSAQGVNSVTVRGDSL